MAWTSTIVICLCLLVLFFFVLLLLLLLTWAAVRVSDTFLIILAFLILLCFLLFSSLWDSWCPFPMLCHMPCLPGAFLFLNLNDSNFCSWSLWLKLTHMNLRWDSGNHWPVPSRPWPPLPLPWDQLLVARGPSPPGFLSHLGQQVWAYTARNWQVLQHT